MTSTLIDTNIILDILGPKGALRQWSIKALARCANEATLHVNEIIVSELAPAIPYERLNPVLGTMLVARSEIGFEAS
ncbi:MAG: DNA-binding protein, partial [Pseudomonadota bacterium]